MNTKRKVTLVLTVDSLTGGLDLQSAFNAYIKRVTAGNADKEHEILSGVLRRTGAQLLEASAK